VNELDAVVADVASELPGSGNPRARDERPNGQGKDWNPGGVQLWTPDSVRKQATYVRLESSSIDANG